MILPNAELRKRTFGHRICRCTESRAGRIQAEIDVPQVGLRPGDYLDLLVDDGEGEDLAGAGGSFGEVASAPCALGSEETKFAVA